MTSFLNGPEQIEKLKEENTQLKKERDEFLERKLLYQKNFRQYEETIKDIEEERNDLKYRVMLLEQKLANKEKEEEAKQSTVEESRQKVTIEKEKKKSVSSDSGISMENPDKEKIGKTIDPKFKEVMHEPKHRANHFTQKRKQYNYTRHG